MSERSGPETVGQPPVEVESAVEPRVEPEVEGGMSGATSTNIAPDEDTSVDPEATSIAPTRASALWTATVVATVLLLLLAVFVGQNIQRSSINFLWWHGHAPIAVLLLLAAVVGAVLVIGAGIIRILQLRHRRGAVQRVDRPPGVRSR